MKGNRVRIAKANRKKVISQGCKVYPKYLVMASLLQLTTKLRMNQKIAFRYFKIDIFKWIRSFLYVTYGSSSTPEAMQQYALAMTTNINSYYSHVGMLFKLARLLPSEQYYVSYLNSSLVICLAQLSFIAVTRHSRATALDPFLCPGPYFLATTQKVGKKLSAVIKGLKFPSYPIEPTITN